MTRSVYLLGGPGSGKSTLMARLLQGWALGPYVRLIDRELFGHHMTCGDETGVYLGHLRPEYPGTDALSLSVAPHALRWLEKLDPQVSLVLGEGARLGHQSFLQALHERTRLLVVHLTVDPEVAAQRRALRPGKELTDAYCRAATTKSANTAAWCRSAGLNLLELKGSDPVDTLAETILLLG